MRSYTVDTAWEDPYDHHEERRVAPRFNYKLRLSLTADDPKRKSRVVGPAIVRNMSMTGMMLVTKHELHPFQRVRVEIPTSGCADSMCLPEMFEGTAEVVRTHALEDGKSNVALRFGDDLAQNMEFAVFIDLLQVMSRATVSSPRVA